MAETLDHLGPYASHEDILDAIEHTVRTHGLAFRLDLGRLLLDAFFDGDLRAYGDRNLEVPDTTPGQEVPDTTPGHLSARTCVDGSRARA